MKHLVYLDALFAKGHLEQFILIFSGKHETKSIGKCWFKIDMFQSISNKVWNRYY